MRGLKGDTDEIKKEKKIKGKIKEGNGNEKKAGHREEVPLKCIVFKR